MASLSSEILAFVINVQYLHHPRGQLRRDGAAKAMHLGHLATNDARLEIPSPKSSFSMFPLGPMDFQVPQAVLGMGFNKGISACRSLMQGCRELPRPHAEAGAVAGLGVGRDREFQLRAP